LFAFHGISAPAVVIETSRIVELLEIGIKGIVEGILRFIKVDDKSTSFSES